jgi:hypothetical protein
MGFVPLPVVELDPAIEFEPVREVELMVALPQQSGKQTTNKTLRNPHSFSYEVSHLRGHGNISFPCRVMTISLLRLVQKSGKIIFDLGQRDFFHSFIRDFRTAPAITQSPICGRWPRRP